MTRPRERLGLKKPDLSPHREFRGTERIHLWIVTSLVGIYCRLRREILGVVFSPLVGGFTKICRFPLFHRVLVELMPSSRKVFRLPALTSAATHYEQTLSFVSYGDASKRVVSFEVVISDHPILSHFLNFSLEPGYPSNKTHITRKLRIRAFE